MKFQFFGKLADSRLLLVAALLLPALFLAKPFHLDDGVFLNMGDRMPWTFFGGEPQDVNFDGQVHAKLSPYESTHPPLIPYLLKLIGAVPTAGQHPFMLYHLLFLVFPLGALLAGLSLARQLKTSALPLWFLLAAPAFLVIATSLMTDVALTAFWMGAVALQLRHDETNRRSMAVGVFLCSCGAMLVAFQAVVVPVLLLAYGFYRKRRVCIWAPLASLLVFTVYLLVIYRQSGFFPILAHTADLNIASLLEMGSVASNQRHKLTAVLVQLGFNLLPAIPWLVAGQNKGSRLTLGWISFVVSAVWFEVVASEDWMGAYSSSHFLVLRLWFVLGCYWVMSLAMQLPRLFRLREVSLPGEALTRLSLLWFFGVITYNIVLMPYVNARYILPALPAALLVAMARSRTNKGLGFGVLLALCLGLGCSYLDQARARSDYALFGEMAKHIKQPQRLYYCNDHGLGRYLSVWGASYLELDREDLPAGSLVLWTGKSVHPKLAEKLREVARFPYASPGGFTLYGPGSGGGFYSSHEGLLPLARAPLLQDAILFERVP